MIGVVVGTVLIVAVLFAGNLGDDTGKTEASKSQFDVGPARARAATIAKDRTPLIFQDPVQFSRPIVVHHLGDEPLEGWIAFDAVVDRDCAVTWRVETQDFTDCRGTRVPADGGALHHYPVVVNGEEHVIVDLGIDATTTTTANSTQ